MWERLSSRSTRKQVYTKRGRIKTSRKSFRHNSVASLMYLNFNLLLSQVQATIQMILLQVQVRRAKERNPRILAAVSWADRTLYISTLTTRWFLRGRTWYMTSTGSVRNRLTLDSCSKVSKTNSISMESMSLRYTIQCLILSRRILNSQGTRQTLKKPRK